MKVKESVKLIEIKKEERKIRLRDREKGIKREIRNSILNKQNINSYS